MDKCVAPDWLMCWTMDLEVWFRNLTASFFFCSWDRHWSLAEPLSPFTNFRKSWQIAGGANLQWTVQLKKQCSPTFRFQRNWDKLQQWLPDSLRVWQSIFPPPPLHSIGDNWSYFRSRWKPCDTPKTLSDPLPLVIVPLKFPFILQKRIEEHRSSTAPVGCHVAAGVLYPLEWSPCVFVHHTQLDPGTHGSMCSTVADIDQVCLIRVPFNSFRVWCFVSSMASWMTRYFPTLLVQLWCKFDAEYRILLYSLWRSSELMAYAVKPRHSEL